MKNSALIRIPACLLLLALLPACDRTPPPALEPAPAAAPEVSGASPAATPAPAAPFLESISSDDARLGTEVGERRLGLGLTTTGKTGWLMFGPYIPLPAGKYEVTLQGLAQDGHAGVVHFDVSRAKARRRLRRWSLMRRLCLLPLHRTALSCCLSHSRRTRAISKFVCGLPTRRSCRFRAS